MHSDGSRFFISGGDHGLGLTPGIVVATVELCGADFCVPVLCETIKKYGCPLNFNTDQGSKFTSADRIDELNANIIKISMDGKGRWMGNVFIERLWRSLKYECVYLNAFDNMKDAKEKLNTWIEYYNHQRPRSSLNDQTLNEVCEGIKPLLMAV